VIDDPKIVHLALAQLTPAQHDVWELRHGYDMSFRAIALHLDLARTTVTDRYDNACRTLRRHGVRFTPDGRPYLEETTTA
jgi:DNA-directed RNA polymerase specialized sigma24 family protein